MRPLSNIIYMFASKLHLLIDSIDNDISYKV